MPDEPPDLAQPRAADASGGDTGLAMSAGIQAELLKIQKTPTSTEPIVELRRITRINTYEVMDSDLEDLDRAIQQENQALAFASLSLGSLISTLVSWFGASSLTPVATAAYWATTIVLMISTLHFWTTWTRERKSRPRLLRRIRSQTVEVREAFRS